MIYELKNTSKVKDLFTGAVDSLVITCLEGMMDSKIYVTDLDDPKSAMAFLAEFAFFAGEPDRELASFKPKGVVGMVPSSEGWAKLIEECQPTQELHDHGYRVHALLRPGSVSGSASGGYLKTPADSSA